MIHLIQIFYPLVFFSLACVGAGFFVLRAITGKLPENRFTELIPAFIMGQGLYGTALLAPALTGLFTKPVIYAMTIPFFCIGLYAIYKSRSDGRILFSENLRAFGNTHLLWQLLSIMVAAILFGAFAAVGGNITDDAKAFYLPLSKVIAASHELRPLPGYESFTSVGILAELQLAVLFLLNMPGASPRLFSWLTGMVCAAALSLVARQAGVGRRGVVVSLAIMGSSSAIGLLWGEGKTELFPAAFGMGAVLYALKSWKETDRSRNIVLAGLFTGFALIGKLTYIVAFLPSMYLLLFWNQFPRIWDAIRQRKNIASALRQHCVQGLIFGVAFLPAFIPHLIKNMMLLGILVDTYGDHAYFSAATTRYIVSIYPLLLTYGNVWGQFGNMSPLLLAFLPLLILIPKSTATPKGPVAAILFAAILGLCCWIIVFPAIPMPRYFLATLLLLTIPAGWVAERCASASRAMLYIVTIISGLTITAFFMQWRFELYPIRNALNYLFIEQSEKALKENEYSSYLVYEAINQAAPPGARVLLLSYFRFWLRPDLLQCVSNSGERMQLTEELGEHFWRQLYEGGFTYIYSDDTATIEKLQKSAPSWVTLQTISPLGDNSAKAFRLEFHGAPGQVRATTREIAPGTWRVIRVPSQ